MNNLKKSLKNIDHRKLSIIGIPYDKNSSFMKGPALAPPAIRKAFHSSSSNFWAENGINLGESSVFFDAGDLEFKATNNVFNDIEEAINLLLNYDLIPISLGGDHSITYPIIKAFKKKNPVIHILQFDAHPDLYDEFQGNRFSNACPFARIMEKGLIDRLVQVGIRTINGHQSEQADRFGVELVKMKDWNNSIRFEFDAPLYISFDVDVLDPAFAPGVSHNEPGGFSTRQVIEIIQNIKAPAIIGADIVEFNPKIDHSGLTARICAKILKEIAAQILITISNPEL